MVLGFPQRNKFSRSFSLLSVTENGKSGSSTGIFVGPSGTLTWLNTEVILATQHRATDIFDKTKKNPQIQRLNGHSSFKLNIYVEDLVHSDVKLVKRFGDCPIRLGWFYQLEAEVVATIVVFFQLWKSANLGLEILQNHLA